MKKKMLVSLGIISGILLLSSGITYAGELDEALKAYLTDPSLDFLGRGFDKILFKENLTMLEDIKTMPLQAKCIYKMVSQKPNALAYSSLGGIYGAKMSMGAIEFNKLALKLLRFVVKY